MVQFNELRISKDGKSLIVDASIRNLPYYKDVYIDKIVIDTQDTFIASGYSTNAIFIKNIEGDKKNVRLELSNGNILTDFTDNLYFIYVVTKGNPTSDTPCTMDERTTLGVTLWECPIFNTIMNSIKELDTKCDIPKNFIDIMLRFKAFEVSVNTENYNQAIIYYNKFIRNIKSDSISTNKCSCYG